jgi:hypothetical protein
MKDTMMHYAKFPYNPNMMLSDGENCIEQDSASVKMRLADALRERKEATTSDDYAFADRKFIESVSHALWAMEQMEKGRPLEQLTFGTYIREADILQPTQAA